MVEIIFQFAEHALKRCPEQGKIHVMEQHFHVSQHALENTPHNSRYSDRLQLRGGSLKYRENTEQFYTV